LTANAITTPAKAADPAAQVYDWIIAGASEAQIIETVEKLWPEADARPLIVSAMKRLGATAGASRELVLGWCIEATRMLYQRAVEAADYSSALRAIKQLHALTQRSGL